MKAEKEKAKGGPIPSTTLPYTNAPGSGRHIIRIPGAREPNDAAAEKAADKASEKPAEKPAAKPVEKAAEKAPDKAKDAAPAKKAPPKEVLPWATQDPTKK
jgi:hypothetical protein